MRIEDLNWMDVESYLKKDDRLILVVGTIEQHGYLSLATDVRIPMALADAASRQTGVLIAPPVQYGISPYFTAFPGTFSIRVSALLDTVEDIIRSAHRQGFRRILVLNGHGGNEALSERLNEVVNALDGLKLDWYSWWTSDGVAELGKKYDLPTTHASWMEAFPFTIVAHMPKDPKPVVPRHAILPTDDLRRLIGDGQYGGPYQVDEAIMDEMFAVCLKDVLKYLEF